MRKKEEQTVPHREHVVSQVQAYITERGITRISLTFWAQDAAGCFRRRGSRADDVYERQWKRVYLLLMYWYNIISQVYLDSLVFSSCFLFRLVENTYFYSLTVYSIQGKIYRVVFLEYLPWKYLSHIYFVILIIKKYNVVNNEKEFKIIDFMLSLFSLLSFPWS